MFSVASGISVAIAAATPTAMKICETCAAGLVGGQHAAAVMAQSVGNAAQGAGKGIS